MDDQIAARALDQAHEEVPGIGTDDVDVEAFLDGRGYHGLRRHRERHLRLRDRPDGLLHRRGDRVLRRNTALAGAARGST
jgi:hypothetical protein